MKDFLAPDIAIRRSKNTLVYFNDLASQYKLFCQLRREAGIEKVDDKTIDSFISAAGKHGLTVETIDLSQINEN